MAARKAAGGRRSADAGRTREVLLTTAAGEPAAGQPPAAGPPRPPSPPAGGGRYGGYGYGGYGPAEAYEADDRHVLDYLRVLYKRRWLAGAVFLVVALTAFITAVTATPVYEATARLQIETDTPNVVNFEEVIVETRFAMRSEYYRTQYEILRSRALARTTMNRLGLWDDPRLRGESAGFNPIGLAFSALTLPLRLFAAAPPPAPPGGTPAAETRAQSVAIDRFLARLDVVPVRDSRIVDVTFSATVPALTADVANALAQAYIDQDLAFRNASSRDASDWLHQRITEQREAVESADLAVQRYREAHGAVSLDDRQNVVAQELADLNAAATQAAAQRIAREARYREMQAVRHEPPALDRFPEILGNDFIQQQKTRLAELQRDEARLAEELGDLHPDLIGVRSGMAAAEARLRDEVAKVVDSVRTEFEVARNEERELRAALDRRTAAALALDRAGIEYGVLAREAESARRIYESLLQRADETDVTGELRTTAIRIVDAAETPLRPSRPRRGRTLLFGIFGGAFFAVGLVFFVEYLDGRVKTPADVRTHLGQPYLGMLPKIALKDPDRTRFLKDADRTRFRLGSPVPENFAAAIRTIRTGLFFSSTEEGCRSVVVTSAEPGDGKSALACNLAIAIAQSGQRTLLVDADLRRPQVHEYWEQERAPGLSDVMVGQAKADAAVRETMPAGLSVLTAGRQSPNPTELVASRRFETFVASQHEHYDWIVFDAPPVLPIADATIVAHAVNHVLFVVDAEATHRRTAVVALERLTAAGANVAGIVLNKVDLDAHPYYYSQYYRRDYRRYYQRT